MFTYNKVGIGCHGSDGRAGEPCALKSGHLEKKSCKVEAQMKLAI